MRLRKIHEKIHNQHLNATTRRMRLYPFVCPIGVLPSYLQIVRAPPIARTAYLDLKSDPNKSVLQNNIYGATMTFCLDKPNHK